jgi:YidC/Oxa1 family membrane protein insertase
VIVAAGVFDALANVFAKPLEWFYGLVGSYGLAIMLITVLVMLILTPLNLKQTKSMLEMQLLQPQLKKLQAEHRGDRQKMQEETMKLYQEHKVNPLASCLPLLAQMPVFIGMFQLLKGLTRERDDAKSCALAKLADATCVGTFKPLHISKTSELFLNLDKAKEMKSFGLDLALSPKDVMTTSFGKGLIYALLVVLLGLLYWVQQRMVASRTVNPTMSASQAKLMQYLPVAFAPFQLFFPTGLVIYYLSQTVLRIAQQAYITKRFYGGEETLGRKAQVASQTARDEAKNSKGGKDDGPTGLFGIKKPAPTPPAKPTKPTSGRVTPPKNARPAAPSRPQKPTTSPNKPATGSRHPKPKKK